ncbi:MAG: hypothetical protein WDN46_16450 [Methylocella sp.]
MYTSVQSVIVREEFDASMAADNTVADVIGIARGMTDMAGRTGEVNADELAGRVRRAVFGYLLGTSTT